MEGKTYSTKALGDKLGVSRSWINKYLRDLGQKKIGIKGFPREIIGQCNTLWYEEDAVEAWLFSHAKFSRQTEAINLYNYGNAEEISEQLAKIENMPHETISQDKAQSEAYDKLLRSTLPEDLYEAALQVRDIRDRGKTPWVTVSRPVGHLDDIYTMKQLQKENDANSTEIIYRNLFRFGAVKMEVHGRTWYMFTGSGLEDPCHAIIVACQRRK